MPAPSPVGSAGFVVTRSVRDQQHLDHRRWCRAAGAPFLHVRARRRYSTIELDAYHHGPPVARLDRAGWEAVWAVLERVGVRGRTRMSGGESRLFVEGVPNEAAAEVALAIRAHLTAPQPSRERSRCD